MVTVYTKNNCPKCMLTKNVLIDNDVKFDSINVDTDLSESEREDKIREFKDLGFMSMPVVFVDGEEPFSDFRPDKLKGLK